jgi:hypothetical protein
MREYFYVVVIVLLSVLLFVLNDVGSKLDIILTLLEKM